VWCDNTRECLALKLRPGNAGANHAGDHLDVLGEAFAQIPRAHRRRLLLRADSAGASHKVVDWLTARNTPRRRVEYSIGWRIDEDERAAITALPATAWSPALDADGELRDGADVAELTGLLALTGWPADMRVIVRRERPHPGAQLDLFETRDGWRYTAFITNTTTGTRQWLQVRHRAHARVEDRVRCAKDTGLRRLPSREFAINEAWCLAAAIACDLTAWLQLLALTGDLAKAEPKRCATASCTPPPGSPAASAAAGCASRQPGPGHRPSPRHTPRSWLSGHRDSRTDPPNRRQETSRSPRPRRDSRRSAMPNDQTHSSIAMRPSWARHNATPVNDRG